MANVKNSNIDDDYMLSTKDNPYNPFTQWDEWYAFDVEKGYCTCAYLGRIANTSDSLSDADQELEIKNAIDEILYYNLTGNYILVYKNDSIAIN